MYVRHGRKAFLLRLRGVGVEMEYHENFVQTTCVLVVVVQSKAYPPGTAPRYHRKGGRHVEVHTLL